MVLENCAFAMRAALASLLRKSDAMHRHCSATIIGLLLACCPPLATAACGSPAKTDDTARRQATADTRPVASVADRTQALQLAERTGDEAPLRSWPAEGDSDSGLAPTARLRPLKPGDVEVKDDRFQSARICGSCHKDILLKWSPSLHAVAY